MKYTKLWMPVEHSDVDLQQLMDHIGPHVRKAHGMYDKHRHKQAPLPDGVTKLPKMYYSHAIDTKAYGYIAVPQSCWQPTGLNVVTLKGLGQVVFAPPEGGRVVRQVRYIAMQSGRWHAACECITEAQEYSRRSLGSLGRLPTEFTLAHLTPAQEQELRNMMLHMSQLKGKTLDVMFVRDAMQQIGDIWILNEHEKSQLSPKQKRDHLLRMDGYDPNQHKFDPMRPYHMQPKY